MRLGRVVGQVVATRKDDALEGKTLLVIQPLDKQGRDRGRTLVGVDAVGAGAGEIIYWCRGREASLAWHCLLYTSPSPRDGLLSRMPSSA